LIERVLAETAPCAVRASILTFHVPARFVRALARL